MKEEIKEILEYVLSITYGNENAIKGVDKVLDYITNLQEENERLKEVINDDMTVYLKGLEDGKEKMKQCFESIYKQRNEKAINFIEHENFKRNILLGVSTKKYTRDILNNVLNILKGDKDEYKI